MPVLKACSFCTAEGYVGDRSDLCLGERIPFTGTDPGQPELNSTDWGPKRAGRQGVTFLGLGLSIKGAISHGWDVRGSPGREAQDPGGVEANVGFFRRASHLS